MRIDAADFFQQAVGHHLIHAAVDAVVEFLAVAGQSHLDDTEGAGLDLLGAEGCVGFPRHVADFEGMDDTLGVFQVNYLVVFGIKQAEFGAEAVEAFLFVAVEHQCARLIVYGRDVVDAFADGIHIHHGTAGQYDDFFFFEQLFKKFHDFRFVLGGAVVIGQAQRAHHVVLHPPELFFGRGGGTYLQLCVQLT